MMIHKRIWEMTQGVRKFIFLKSGVGILISISYIVQAVFLGKIIMQVYGHENVENLYFNLIILITMLMARIFLIWFNQVYGKWIVSRVKNTLRKRAYRKLMDLGPGYMVRNRTGELESTIVAGIDYLEGYLSLYIPQILVCLIGSGLMILYVFTVHGVLGLLILGTFLTALYSPVLFLSILNKSAQEHWASYMDLNAEFVDTLQGMITLKAFNASTRIGGKLKGKMHRLFDRTMSNLKLNLMDVGVSGFLTSLGSAFTLGLAAYYMAWGRLSIGELSVLLFLTYEVYRPLTELGMYFHQGFMGMTSTDGILRLFDAEIFVKDKKDAKVSEKVFATPPFVEFKDVEFHYDKAAKKIFKGLNFLLEPGEKLAIVGESGSGKTTLINLLMRFYDPLQGSIYYNGMDIKDCPLSFLRSQIALVSQETYLFNGSLSENLRLAKEDATQEEMIEACKAAQIHDFILSMPEGYETIVGERGLNLSGGQRQRIAIARALLKNVPLIILDEATSSVDMENEKSIQESMDYLLRNKTAITIAHRLSTVKNADRILVLRRGVIVEEGTHEELMNKKEYYYRLVLAQNEGVYNEENFQKI